MPGGAGLTAWRQYLRGHATVARALETELVLRLRLSLAGYEVLAVLADAPHTRMTDLADAVLLSRSGVTRLVDRLERHGLVTRSRVSGDRRGITAALTEHGRQQYRQAAEVHADAVRRHFLDRLDEVDLGHLRRISLRLAGTDGDDGRMPEPKPDRNG